MMSWTADPLPGTATKRLAERAVVAIPARMTWKDHRGATRFASVVVRNVSELGAYVECRSAVSIPLYRLVQFQLERDAHDADSIPTTLRHARVLSAVYRVTPATRTGAPQGLALRLMVDPKRRPTEVAATRATA